MQLTATEKKLQLSEHAVNCNRVVTYCSYAKMQLTATEKKLQLCENAVNCNRAITAFAVNCIRGMQL